MLKKKRKFASVYIGETNFQGTRLIDLHEPSSALNNLHSLDRMFLFLAEAAKHSQQDAAMHRAKIQLLTQLTQLTRAEITTDLCVGMLTDSLATLCQADHVYIYDNQLQCQLPAEGNKRLRDTPAVIRQAVDEKKVKVVFDETSDDIAALKQTQANIAGSLTFPIICKDEVLRVIHCYLPQEMLDYITLETISLVEQACHQLRIILERIKAQENLKAQHEELSRTLTELKTTKAQLYQSEKLASIGELAAGIAHEINNPLAFVASNFQSLMTYVNTMADVLTEHGDFLQTLKQTTSTGIDFGPIEEKQKQSDVTFILEDVDELIGDSKDGLNRIREIIDNLLSFSRKDSIEKQDYDLREGIQSTLKILHTKLKGGVVVKTDFGSTRTLVCNPGLINQVFLNMVQNAADAMNGQGEIHIRTWEESDVLRISIRDNGPGIPRDIVTRIFDPFFTTKEVGKGTGLGLSISHSIVEQHQGRIEVDSAPGKFTEFLISLPLFAEAA
ncbi:MAG: sensor histidine kinase [Gammaproteobacteria bacterium]